MSNSHFKRHSAVFNCRHCGRKTRDVNGNNGSVELCEDCNEGCIRINENPCAYCTGWVFSACRFVQNALGFVLWQVLSATFALRQAPGEHTGPAAHRVLSLSPVASNLGACLWRRALCVGPVADCVYLTRILLLADLRISPGLDMRLAWPVSTSKPLHGLAHRVAIEAGLAGKRAGRHRAEFSQ